MRAVFDTNVVVSTLLFRGGRLSWLREVWRHGHVTPVVDNPSVYELIRVLTYPKFKLNRQQIEALLVDYLPFAETVTEVSKEADLPECRDSDDQKFLTLAYSANVDFLVTGDEDLLDLDTAVDFEILKPAELARRLGLPDG